LKKRTPDSRNCLLKPCCRWLLVESTDDRPETGIRAVDV
jgi:hypothetical protein